MISVPPMMIAAHPMHHPQMPWDGVQPVFLANPAEYQQMMAQQQQQQRPGSVDSESSSSKSSSRRGSLSKSGNEYNKFVPSMKKMQLAEIEEMAQQADRMRISEKKIRERRPSNGSSADSGTGGFPVCFPNKNYL